MTASTEALAAALLPCSKRSDPNYAVTGSSYAEYDQACVSGNCPKQCFAPREACGVSSPERGALWRFFGSDCPVEASNEPFEWFVWMMMQRGVGEDGGAGEPQCVGHAVVLQCGSVLRQRRPPDQETAANFQAFQQSLRPPHPSCLCPSLSPPSELVQGVAMSTSAATPFRSFVQTPIFSVSPSSFSLQQI